MSQVSVDAARGLVAAYNEPDWDRLGALLAPGSLYDEVGTGRRARGSQEITELFKGWKRAMPDSEGTVTNALECGDIGVLEVTWTGTFTGPWAAPHGEVDATGKSQTSRACIVFVLEGERIKEFRQYFDSMALMQQLGVVSTSAVT